MAPLYATKRAVGLGFKLIENYENPCGPIGEAIKIGFAIFNAAPMV